MLFKLGDTVKLKKGTLLYWISSRKKRRMTGSVVRVFLHSYDTRVIWEDGRSDVYSPTKLEMVQES